MLHGTLAPNLNFGEAQTVAEKAQAMVATVSWDSSFSLVQAKSEMC
jgi:hypothetical protein